MEPTWHPVQLREVFVKSLSLRRTEIFEATEGPLSVAINTSTQVVSDVEARSTVDVTVAFPQSDEPEVEISASGVGVFVCPPGYAHIREFVESQGGYFVYTFLRVVISNATVQAGIPPIVLPLVQIPAPQSQNPEEPNM